MSVVIFCLLDSYSFTVLSISLALCSPLHLRVLIALPGVKRIKRCKYSVYLCQRNAIVPKNSIIRYVAREVTVILEVWLFTFCRTSPTLKKKLNPSPPQMYSIVYWLNTDNVWHYLNWLIRSYKIENFFVNFCRLVSIYRGLSPRHYDCRIEKYWFSFHHLRSGDHFIWCQIDGWLLKY